MEYHENFINKALGNKVELSRNENIINYEHKGGIKPYFPFALTTSVSEVLNPSSVYQNIVDQKLTFRADTTNE